MKKIRSIFLLLLVSSIAFAQNNFDVEALLKQRPNPAHLVNDYTTTLTPDQKDALEQKLVAFDDSTSTQIAVVIIPSLNGNDIADFNVKLLRAWGVGNKKTNNGSVLLIAKEDRKLNITTGYGLEGALPDITCKQIIDEIIVPQFKNNGDYYQGINSGTNAMMQAVKGEYTAPDNYNNNQSGFPIGKLIIPLIIIVLFLFLSSRGRGGGGGGYMSRQGFAPFIIGNIIGNLTGGGGGGGSDFGGGGGFGGFGGGSSGGGGASGSW